MNIEEISIKFEPFEIEHKDTSNVGLLFQLDLIVNVMIVDWCTFPDILLVESTRKFVGVSFAVLPPHQHLVQDFVAHIADERCRYVSVSSEESGRYVGFGSNDRLELYWDNQCQDFCCEMASLDTGAWIYRKAQIGKPATTMPIGFNMIAITEIMDAHDLT
jgi:hypothetical protein